MIRLALEIIVFGGGGAAVLTWAVITPPKKSRENPCEWDDDGRRC